MVLKDYHYISYRVVFMSIITYIFSDMYEKYMLFCAVKNIYILKIYIYGSIFFTIVEHGYLWKI